MYDIFYILKDGIIDSNFKKLKKRIPLIKIVTYTYNKSEALFKAQKKSLTSFFWVINLKEDECILDSFNFSYIVPEWDKNYIHIWKDSRSNYDGVFLIPKTNYITKNEATHFFFINKKEIDQQVAFIQYDIFFISYDEPNADANFETLSKRYPEAKRIHGVKGIHNAHMKAAQMSETSMFWVIDGDAELVENFKLDFIVEDWMKDAVFVWKSKNPVNDLVYGYGGVKLLPKKLTSDLDNSTIDMTTSISNKFNSMTEISNITVFNTDPFNTWKSAFRECVKLSSKIIDGQVNQETLERLEIWCTKGIDQLYGEFAINGANFGKYFGSKYSNDKSMLIKINDWEWLKNEFIKKN